LSWQQIRRWDMTCHGWWVSLKVL